MNKKINNQGQVLLIVVVSLAVLLGVGLSISSNTISSTQRTSRTDSFQKVTAAAEGGIEKSLALTDKVLGDKVSSASTIEEQFTASNTKATVKVENYSAGSSGVIFETLQSGEVGTFYFIDTSSASFEPSNTLNACVKISTTTQNPSYMLNVYYQNPAPAAFTNLTQAAVPPVPPLDSTQSNTFLKLKYLVADGNFLNNIKPESCSNGGFLFNGPIVLRIHPVNSTLNNVKIEVIGDESGNQAAKEARQGFKLTSKGEFISGGDGSNRVIEAVKFLDAPSNLFDYAAFIDNE